jgi:hypothetical protein
LAFDGGAIGGDVLRIVQAIAAGHSIDPWYPMGVLCCLVNARLMLWQWGKW